jgi:hypothetical protein
LELVAFRNLPAADQLNSLVYHLNELIVVLANLREQLDFVLSDKLKSIEIVAKLVELAQRGLKRSFVVDQES